MLRSFHTFLRVENTERDELLKWLERLGLVWDIQTPDTLPMQRGITRVTDEAALIEAPKLSANAGD
jgi:hypothetical protein